MYADINKIQGGRKLDEIFLGIPQGTFSVDVSGPWNAGQWMDGNPHKVNRLDEHDPDRTKK